MEPLSLIAGAGLFLALAYAVGSPLFSGRASRTAAPPEAGEAAALATGEERKEQLYAALRELEFDRALGKVSAEDFNKLRPRLEAEALAVLREQEALTGKPGPADPRQRLESEVRAARAALGEPPVVRCASCGAEQGPANPFCPKCGARLTRPRP
jgi:hypothetical protein